MRLICFGFDLFYDALRVVVERPGNTVLKLYSFPSDGFFDFNDQLQTLASDKRIPFTQEPISAEELRWQFEENGCELAFCAGYAYRIPVEVTPRFRGINLHPSLLPQGRGPWPLPHVLLKGLNQSGVTAHRLTASFDEGEILLQESFHIDKEETYGSLAQKTARTAAEMTRRLFSDLDGYFRGAYAQGKGEYWPEPSDRERTIYRNTTPERAALLRRAFGDNYLLYSEQDEPEDV